MIKKLALAGGSAVALLAAVGAAPALAIDSTSCTSPTATVADGFAGGTYVKLRAQQSSGDTLVCVRLDNGTSVRFGGALRITGASADAPAPAVDESSSACSTTTGNTAPGPHPLLKAAVGEPATPIEVDTYAKGRDAWVCVTAGSVKRRVAIRLPNLVVPSVAWYQDAAPPAPSPEAPTPGYPSSGCQNVNGNRTEV